MHVSLAWFLWLYWPNCTFASLLPCCCFCGVVISFLSMMCYEWKKITIEIVLCLIAATHRVERIGLSLSKIPSELGGRKPGRRVCQKIGGSGVPWRPVLSLYETEAECWIQHSTNFTSFQHEAKGRFEEGWRWQHRGEPASAWKEIAWSSSQYHSCAIQICQKPEQKIEQKKRQPQETRTQKTRSLP